MVMGLEMSIACDLFQTARDNIFPLSAGVILFVWRRLVVMPPLSTVTRNGEIIRQIPSIFPKLIVFSGQTARLVEGEEA